ncbi:MAG: recombination mediator RecR [Candidatus Babeliales bacterium]
MIEHSPVFKQLLKSLQQVPYLASKNLYRVAAHFLSLDSVKAEQFCKAILQAKEYIAQCERCCTWKEKKEKCFFCDSPKRMHDVICVVETWQELITIEKTGGYTGLYHVLGGAIYPLEGVGPENLTIDQLVARVDDDIKEIILATNQTPEGEATASYIVNQLKSKNIKISCLARGIPVGSSLEYMDRVTLYKALSDRRPY